MRTSVRRAIIELSRSFYPPKSPLIRPTGDPPMTTAASDPQIVPQPASLRRPCAPPTRAWPTPWSPSSPTTPGASTAPSGDSSPTGATRCASAPCRRSPSPSPATWPPGAGSGASIATMRLAASAIAKAHEWAKQESPCRDAGGRASLKGWGRRLWPGPSARPAPHRRRAGRDSAHRSETPCPRPRLRNARAGR